MKELFRQYLLAERFEDAYGIFLKMDYLIASGILIGLTARGRRQTALRFGAFLGERRNDRRLQHLRSALEKGRQAEALEAVCDGA